MPKKATGRLESKILSESEMTLHISLSGHTMRLQDIKELFYFKQSNK